MDYSFIYVTSELICYWDLSIKLIFLWQPYLEKGFLGWLFVFSPCLLLRVCLFCTWLFSSLKWEPVLYFPFCIGVLRKYNHSISRASVPFGTVLDWGIVTELPSHCRDTAHYRLQILIGVKAISILRLKTLLCSFPVGGTSFELPLRGVEHKGATKKFHSGAL